MDRGEFFYQYDPNGINEVIDELSASSYLALREVRWNDGDDYKLDLRRYFVKQDDTEMPGKGTSIANPNKLTEVLVQHGFGNAEAMIGSLDERDELLSGLGRYCADMSLQDYQTFKDDLDAERDKAIQDRGMSSEEFMENLT